jgi:putative ABC transport system permease protein
VAMGFNVLVLPEGQNLADFYVDGRATKYMPESYAARLAGSRVVTVQHILPSLHERVRWPERKMTINLVGVRGELARGTMADERKPILEAVPRGAIVLGAELCRITGVRSGATVGLKGRAFRVSKCHEQRGNQDDVTAWINLDEAQEMMGRDSLINAIFALECRCAADSTLPNILKVRSEVGALLPGTKVVEFMSKAITRAEARYEAVAAAREALASEESHRAALRAERMRIAGLLLPLVVAACLVIVGLLVFANVRNRRYEIAVVRTVGWGGGRILALFLGKALLLGIAGGALGVAAGGALAAVVAVRLMGVEGWVELAGPRLVVGVLVAAPLLAVVASWVPALSAATADPAVVLQKE